MANDILGKLASKHAMDVFIEECKNGPTHTANHKRLDAWVMKRSWSPITMIGYEIKQSRSDFLKDEKWPAYLPLCHQLYFVCPRKLIQPEELPQDVGLLWAGDGERLMTQRKAVRREIVLPGELLVYVLMCRAQITREHLSPKHDREYWVDWLKEKTENRELGYHVAQAIRDKVVLAEGKASSAAARMQEYDQLRAELKKHGVDPDSHWEIRGFQSRLTDLVGGSLKQMDWNLRGIEETVRHLRQELNKQKEGP